MVQLKTDSQPFRDFSLVEFGLAGYDILWSCDDCRAAMPQDPTTGYEERLCAQGASVFCVQATPGELPAHIEQTEHLSLMDYLPKDISTMDYVPHGMERTVTNIRNLEAKGKSRYV